MANLNVTLTGSLGTAAAGGSAIFTPSGWETDATNKLLIPPSPQSVTLPAAGTFSVSLLATDNPAPLPAGWTWSVTFQIPGINASTFSFFLPASPFSFTATHATPAVFTAAGSAYVNGAQVVLSGAGLPGGFTAGTTYFVVSASGTTFGLAATSGGAALASTTTGSGTVATATTDISTISPVQPATPQYPLNPMTTLGDMIYESAVPAPARLPGNTTTTRNFLRQQGTGTASAVPAWDTLQDGDLPSGIGSIGTVVVPSGDTTGATDQAAITAAEALGGTVYFAPGTYWVTGLVKQSSTIWQGPGILNATIKLANGANKDVIQGANFATLTLGGSNGGISGWAIRDLSVDGNKANQSGTSYGLRVYGYEFDLTRISIRNCLTDCLYTEWSQNLNPGLDSSLEASYVKLHLHDSGGNGWVNRGPSDSRAYDVTIFHNALGLGTSVGYWGQAWNATTVAAGSNGVNVNTFTGAGVLNVATTLGAPAASVNSTQGSLTVATSGGTAVITYTGTTATSFTGCTTVSGTGTLSTGGSVSPTGGGYTSAGALLEGVHVYGGALWDYILDTQAHLIDCVGEVSGSASGGIVLVRGNTTSQITGGLYICYPVETQAGCGIQLGDAANICFGLRADTFIFGLAGTSAASAAINVVNDAGGNSIDALVYQTSGTPVWSGGAAGFGSVNSTSRYRVYASGGATLGTDANNGLDQTAGQVLRYVPGSAANAWTLRNANSGTQALNLNTTSNHLDHNNGLLDAWWSGNFATQTASISGATGAISGSVLSAAGLAGATAASRYAGATTSGAPSTGTFAAGDFVIDQTGSIWACIVAGSPGTWVIVPRLDPTASHLQPDGAAAAGANLLGSDSGHVHPSMAGGYERMGSVIGWTGPPTRSQASVILTGAAGFLIMFLIEIPQAATTSNFNMFVTTAGNTLANVFAALVNTSGTIVAQTANRAADAALTTNNSLWSPPWSSPFAAPAGEYYGCLLIGSATTMPTFTSESARTAAYTNFGCSAAAGNLRTAAFGSGSFTSLPGSVTMASISSYANCCWAALT